MFNLVFSSQAYRTMSHYDLFLLLTQSRKNNQRLNITGVLLYNCDRFIQLIEGEKDVVLQLFSKIKTDIRHKDITLVLAHDIKERRFLDWSMGFSEADEVEKYNIPGYSRFLENDFDISPLYMDANNALHPLLDFKQNALLNNLT
jgi:Sensors of blue-light using FAD